MKRTLLAIAFVVGWLTSDLVCAQVSLQEQFSNTIKANEKVLTALKALDDDALADLTVALSASIQTQNDLLKIMSNYEVKGDTIQMIHPTLDIPVRTRQITAWMQLGRSSHLTGQVVFQNGKWLTFGNVNIYPQRKTTDILPSQGRSQSSGGAGSSSGLFFPAPQLRSGASTGIPEKYKLTSHAGSIREKAVY